MKSATCEAERPLAVSDLVDDRYRVTGRVGRGGMGEVYAVIDQATGARMALKRMRAHQHSNRIRAFDFIQEFQTLASLSHPNIVRVHEAGVDHGVPYYTMELLDGQDLSELVPLSFMSVCLCLRDI